MTSGSAASHLPDIERRRLRALADGDVATAAPLHADDYQLITPNGSAMTRDDYLGDVESGRLPYRVFEPVSDIVVLAMPRSRSCATRPASASTTDPASRAGTPIATGCRTSGGRWSGPRPPGSSPRSSRGSRPNGLVPGASVRHNP